MNLPTPETYDELQRAYDFFNEKLFSNELPPCLITLQREKRTYGYCSFKRFVGRESGYTVDEIAMNPVYFSIRTIKATLSTLVHEMVHQWQFHFGEPGRRGYHNKQWAAR
ncbi:TPA: SprT-like domain-containing protein, partial [Citrobacter freundii]|nr:SprT-like domain-containing protein [Escherichia coli]HBZ9569929.1 SprT-like domain-containing protein [Citrobacter freundii]HDU3788387.1 SprT-like domain-containing protein [Klebsiella pneumoniae subsp. pneumoniae]HCA1226190.1 SprT-like domain-containing protein [Citrobacter freundii]HCA1614362.1 SprT-like domain-containing protein [Citrobacter freundii]